MLLRRPGVPNKTAPARPAPVAPEAELAVAAKAKEDARVAVVRAQISEARHSPLVVELRDKAAGYCDELLDDARELAPEQRQAGYVAVAGAAQKLYLTLIDAMAADLATAETPPQPADPVERVGPIDYSANPFHLDEDEPETAPKSGEQIHRELEAQRRVELLGRKRGGK